MVKNLHISTKWTGPTRDQSSCPQSERTQQGSKTYTSPQGGWTPWEIKILIHKMDGPHQGLKFMSTKWTDPARVKNLHKSTRWTNPTRDQDSCPRSGRTQQGLKNYVLKVDEPNKGQNYTSPQVVGHHEGYTIKPIHKVDGHMSQQMRWP